jgi:RNA polymerase sigma-70 factor, ECF subfamily
LGANTPENRLKAVDKVDEERLLVEAAKKDPCRFAELYERHFALVYAYAARRLGNRTEAQDVTSEVFHQALANIGNFEWRGVPFGAWLIRIAANALSDHRRRAAREQGNPAPDNPGHGDVSPEEIEQRAQLFRMVARLPAVQRRVIQMRFAEEKGIREIAKAIRKTEGAVKQLQFRALDNLRALTAQKRKPGKNTGEAHG